MGPILEVKLKGYFRKRTSNAVRAISLLTILRGLETGAGLNPPHLEGFYAFLKAGCCLLTRSNRSSSSAGRTVDNRRSYSFEITRA
jgi:hypothetical protein